MRIIKNILQNGFAGSALLALILSLISILLGLLGPVLGMEAAFHLLMVQVGLGALISWGIVVSGGSGSPTLRRVIFFNESDKKALRMKLKKEPKAGDPSPPEEVPAEELQSLENVDPGGNAEATALAEPFLEGVQHLVVTIDVEDPPGSGTEFPVPLDIMIPDENPDPPMNPWGNHFAGSITLVLSNTNMPPPEPQYQVTGVLYHAEEETQEPSDTTTETQYA